MALYFHLDYTILLLYYLYRVREHRLKTDLYRIDRDQIKIAYLNILSSLTLWKAHLDWFSYIEQKNCFSKKALSAL